MTQENIEGKGRGKSLAISLRVPLEEAKQSREAKGKQKQSMMVHFYVFQMFSKVLRNSYKDAYNTITK